MPPPTAKCLWCDRTATYLCDFIVHPANKRDGTEVTCDKPFCADHRHCHASGHMRPAVKGGPRPFSVDFCPDHSPKEVTA